MTPHDDTTRSGGQRPVLLIMVPGMGMRADEFHANGLVADAQQHHARLTATAIDPGPDSYLDGSVEDRLLAGIDAAKDSAPGAEVWLAGISLGCQGILRCVRRRPHLAEGLFLLTPYLASTGLIAEAVRTGGLRRWAASRPKRDTPERAFLAWLGSTQAASLPPMLVGQAERDRFASTATLLAEHLPPERMLRVPGGHDWSGWSPLWRLMLARNPFRQPLPMAS